jgi:hypothetical protein
VAVGEVEESGGMSGDGSLGMERSEWDILVLKWDIRWMMEEDEDQRRRYHGNRLDPGGIS